MKLTFVTMDISMEINSVRMEKMIADDMTNLNEYRERVKGSEKKIRERMRKS